jgi:hypothetical protein
MNDWIQRGYDAFVELWLRRGSVPATSECPARAMQMGSDERRAVIAGWLKARDEVTL